MNLATIEVQGVRNLAEQSIETGRGLNLLTGANGQGKSSLLESVYLLGTTRSFRTSKIGDVVSTGAASARVSGQGEQAGETLAVLIAGPDKSYLRHGKKVAASEYIGALDVIALSSDLVQGFRHKPSERRRFLDRMALATWPSYLDELRDFRRASAQRAVLLASGGGGAAGGAERRAWDERAAALAVPIARRRAAMAAALESHLRAASTRIFPEGQDAKVRLAARPGLDAGLPDAEAEARYREQLIDAFARQQPSPGRRETPAGPSRDDLTIDVGGRNILRFGSSGQVRSLLAAATLGEMTRLAETKGRYPVLVLDDVESDLDEERYGALLGALGNGPQVFAATSKPRLTHPMLQTGSLARRFTVSDGVVAAA